MTLGALAPADPDAGVVAVSEAQRPGAWRGAGVGGARVQRPSPPQVTRAHALQSRRGRVEHLRRGRQPRRAPVPRRARDRRPVYIDPPYNTGNAFAYRDDLRGGDWVEMMRPRLRGGARGAGRDRRDLRQHRRQRAGPAAAADGRGLRRANFLAQIVVNLNAKGRQLGKGFATSHEYLLATPATYAGCVLDASSPETVDPRGLPVGGARRAALPAPAAAQHQQEVQPRDRAHPALPRVRRPGVGPRGRRRRSTAPSRSSRCSATAARRCGGGPRRSSSSAPTTWSAG